MSQLEYYLDECHRLNVESDKLSSIIDSINCADKGSETLVAMCADMNRFVTGWYDRCLKRIKMNTWWFSSARYLLKKELEARYVTLLLKTNPIILDTDDLR